VVAIPSQTERAMTQRAHCPMCADGEVTRSEGKLEQSGDTYLPTGIWTCNTCGYVRYEPATVAHWRPRDVRASQRPPVAPPAPQRLVA
jgi:ribosomal protein L37AE/L43A